MAKEISGRFNEKPKEKSSWRVLWFGLAALFAGPLLGFVNVFLRKTLDPVSYNPSQGNPSGGMLGVLVTMGFAIAAIRLFVKKYKLGERSWVLWSGLAISCLIVAFWAVFITGEIIYPH